MTELLKQNLPVEPDVQNFIGFVLTAVDRLGGNPFAASLAALNLSGALRRAGAGTGFPLPVSLWLEGRELSVRWNGHAPISVARLREAPQEVLVNALRDELRHSTEAADPALLLRRNQEMARYLDESRARMEHELRIMQTTLEQRQAELWETVRQAETDPLTGLLNRRAFDDRIEKAFKRVMRQKNESLSLALLDLDFFKQINDEYGHPFGDAYLNKMGHAMRDVIRTDVDFAFRIGGDEFAMLIFADRSTSCRKALQVLDTMNHKVSIGVACIQPGSPFKGTMAEFIKRADEALYAAKRAGRGRVLVADCEGHPTGCLEHCSTGAEQ